MRKILFIIPSLKGGGAERVLINLLHLLKENTSFQITLCCVVKKGVHIDSIPEGIDVKYLYKSDLINKIVEKSVRDFGINLLLKARAKRVIKGHYDVGVSFLDSVFSEILFYLGPRLNKRILVIHSSYLTYSNKSRFIRGKHKIRLHERYAKVDTIVSVSNDVQREFVEAFGPYKDMRVIYNPINVDQIREKAKAHVIKPAESKVQLLTIGSLIPVKNHFRLLRVVDLLVQEGIDFHLKILGKGRLQQELQSFIEERGLGEYVEMPGFVENPYAILNSADIFILSSIAEGLPTVICEAMVLGVPVVSTNCPGSREILDHGNFGVLTEQDDYALFDGIKRLINDEERACYRAKSLERAEIFDDLYALKEYVSILE